MSHSLFIVLERGRYYGSTKIVSVTRRRPKIRKPTEQSVVKLNISVPSDIFAPREVSVDVKREHIAHQPVTVASVPA